MAATLGTVRAVVGGLSLIALLFVCLNGSLHPFHTRVVTRYKQKHFTRPVAGPAVALAADVCANSSTYLEHTEFWGALVMPADQNTAGSAAECCALCRDFEPTLEIQGGRPCTTFVYHPTTRACWLKSTQQQHLDRPGRGPAVPWTSGIVPGPHRPCADCALPSAYVGCVTKALCNTSRQCGSPAIDGYSRVDPKCLERSAEAARYRRLLADGAALQAHVELAADYDGLGVRWGIGHTKQRWEDCQAACYAHRPTGSGPFGSLPCNVWTWCGAAKCWEPDAHSHSYGDCWCGARAAQPRSKPLGRGLARRATALTPQPHVPVPLARAPAPPARLKFSEQPEAPEVNMRLPMPRAYMRRHGREMAGGVPWVSGALLAPGLRMTNGTWGPRAFW